MKLHLRPEIAWPLFIVSLLLMSVTAAVITLVAAESNGGVQIVDDYYEKGVHWDDRQDDATASGWNASVTVGQKKLVGGLRTVDVVVADKGGEPVAGLEGTLRLRRPESPEATVEAALEPSPGRPGAYRQIVPIDTTGRWIFELDANRDGKHFQARIKQYLPQ